MDIINTLNSPLAVLGISVVLAIIFVASLVSLYQFLKKDNGYAYEVEIESVLMPYLYRAIVAAFKTSEAVSKKFGEELDDVNRKRIADAVYDILPPSIIGIPIEVLKDAVPREQFETMVQELYDAMVGYYHSNETHFLNQAEEWLKENKA